MERTLENLDHGWWIVSHEQKLWLPKAELPYGQAADFGLAGEKALQIGTWEDAPVWLVLQKRDNDMASVRQLIDLDAGLFQLAGRGVQLAEFYRSHKFCGYCGHEMHPSKTEWAMLCGHCRERYYPQIAPCIIVAIRREDKILLAQHTRHRNGVYTVLAGFVEVGETLEQAVAREVMEESSIRVKNLRYVTSQPWPFPQSLMTAFTADYDSGDIKIDPKELIDAGWYRYDQLPLLPAPGTVARRLIEDTVARCRADYE
ncbi:NAD(+) diphosphatase [Cronobacter dublinensis]|uniref:NAD-capped RNA hydrolase NudC n=1 Tax=Cronobacter dublinensis 1210 TaxID=1208656 RepID=A0ABM9Q626_9ENTR|nr:NAD(+) diphosphatase [Cronobacter dublinensis]EGT5713355.1 NAD(+) diphosphatase [Cronobacter dublinensis subsp. dublinensis]CCJ80881.1 NADH pyrophosphatase [Cronobacter dublinensis 1210]ALB65262.1 NADH pyrophosphatase [Cronobacter dublinensis subsp. dublinensis LMG 23823]EGT5737396.1 NAD(+) diphosphatase [Cronobacter dublinensis subsp. dublinensis]MDI7272625.1 NAD(+) diphosphatase [Cronobacter dublinensis]